MTPRTSPTVTLLFSLAATLSAAACDRVLPIGSIPGEFPPHDHGSGGSYGSGGSAGPSGSGGFAPGVKALEVAPGWYHACARLADGSTRCWGDNQLGELGDGSTNSSQVPRTVVGLSDVAKIQTGNANSCAVMVDGTVRCWGSDLHGQFGDGATGAYSTPMTAFGGAVVRQLSLGQYHACAIYDDGHVGCTGLNAQGQLGDGGTIERHTPIAVPGLSGVQQIATAANATCALLSDQTVSCWGEAALLDPCATSDAPPTPPTPVGVSNALKIAAGGGHACALLADHTVTCWGSNLHGEVGAPPPAGSTCTSGHRPVVAAGLTGVMDVTAGGSHTCALMNDGASMMCWGSNKYGLVGGGGPGDSYSPPTSFGFFEVTQQAAGYASNCAVWGGGTLSCWGAVGPSSSPHVDLAPELVLFF